jgi:polysaccharide export outer membrane protein
MLKPLVRAALLLLCAGVLAQAQQSGVPASPAAQPQQTAPAIAASYVLGPGDIIGVNVYGQPELAGNLQLDRDGTVILPYGHTPVHAAGLTAMQLQPRIAAALVKDQLSLHPLVSVRVLTVASKPITIVGAVKSPVVIQAIQPIPLLDALVQAGGLAVDSGSHILLTRPGKNGPQTQEFAVSQLIYSDRDQSGPMLTGGEQIRVLPAGHIYVTGSVRGPGSFPITPGDPMSVIKAITLAHGWDQYGNASHAVVLHPAPGGAWKETALNLPLILDHRAADVPMQANDILYIPDNRGKRLTEGALDHGIAVFTSAAGYALGLFLAQ